jgi:hypothetical protein
MMKTNTTFSQQFQNHIHYFNHISSSTDTSCLYLFLSNGTHTLKRKARDFANYLKDTTWNYSRCENDIVIFLSKEQKLVI